MLVFGVKMMLSPKLVTHTYAYRQTDKQLTTVTLCAGMRAEGLMIHFATMIQQQVYRSDFIALVPA